MPVLNLRQPTISTKHCCSVRSSDHRFAILLAAGAGRRFGGRKMLADWHGQPLIRASAAIALQAPVARVLAISGADHSDIVTALGPLHSERLSIHQNRDWSTGIASSLGLGLKLLPAEAEQVVVFLGDMPLVPVEAASALFNALDGGAPAALSTYRDMPAHPVAFTRSLFPSLSRLSGDRGGRAILSEAPGAVTVPVSNEDCVFDIDYHDQQRLPSSKAKAGS